MSLDINLDNPLDTPLDNPTLTSASPPVPRSEKRDITGRPQNIDLDPYKALIIDLYSSKDVPIIEIARKLERDCGLECSGRTVARRLTAWNVPRKDVRGMPTQEIQDRIRELYNKNYTDEQIHRELVNQGYAMKDRNIATLRGRMGLRRRGQFSEFREFSDSAAEIAAQILEETGQSQGTLTKRKKPNPPPKPKHNEALIPKVSEFVEVYMSRYDGSHDFNHIRRVVGLAHVIYTEMNVLRARFPDLADGEELDLHVLTLGALLHDVGDKKYLEPGEDPNTLVLATLLGLGAPEELALKVQRIVSTVSYSAEIKDRAAVQSLIWKYPELAVIQDADRLDALGAIGIGRTFTFGGAHGAIHMGETLQHFDDKLLKLEGMMKTAPGKRMAKERSEKLRTFKKWWDQENKEAEGSLRKK